MGDGGLMDARVDAALAASRPTPRNGFTPAQVARARDTAESFEAMFIGQLLRPMFNGLESAPPFGGGHAEKVWRDLMIDEVGKQMAKSGGIGIADSVMRQMLVAQETAQ